MKSDYYNLKQTTNEKDNEIKNLYQSMNEGNRMNNQLENELNAYKKNIMILRHKEIKIF